MTEADAQTLCSRPTKLLNYLTAPDCVIWSAISALDCP